MQQMQHGRGPQAPGKGHPLLIPPSLPQRLSIAPRCSPSSSLQLRTPTAPPEAMNNLGSKTQGFRSCIKWAVWRGLNKAAATYRPQHRRPYNNTILA